MLALWRWQMFHASIIDLSFCSPVCQKWSISIKCRDETMKGWCTLLRALSEMKFLIYFSAREPSSLPCLILLPLISPPSYNLSLHTLPYFLFISSFHCLSPRLHYFSPPFPVSVSFVWLPPPSLLYFCFSPVFLHQYISHFLWQLLSFCLLPVSLPVCRKTGP